MADPIDIGLSGRQKILVAEDEQNIASLLEDWLSDDFDVILASNGAGALQKAKWNKPDAIIMDIIMPDTGGYEVVCALQGDPVTSKIPVIVMTAKNFDDSTVKLIKAERNVLGFLNKPFKPDELRKQLKLVMSGQRTFGAPSGAARPAVGPPVAPPVRAPLPPVPPTPGAILSPATPLPPVPPTPGAVLSPPLMPLPQMSSPSAVPAPVTGLVHGFPEIVPTSPLPAAPAPVRPPAPSVPAAPLTPLPPFLRPAPSSIPSTPPPPPAFAASSAAGPALVLEPTSALPPPPSDAAELPRLSLPSAAFPETPLPPAGALMEKLTPRVRKAPPPPVVKEESEGPSSWVMIRVTLWILKNVFLVGVFFAGLFFAAETSCRWTERALKREVFLPPVRPSRYAELPYMLAADGGWKQGGVSYSINAWGLRSDPVDLIKPKDAVRVVLLGGTSLFGAGAPAEDGVTARLSSLLNKGGGPFRWEVVNGGLWGYSPAEQWAFYEKAVAELKPDVLVWLCEEKAGGFPVSERLKDVAQGSVLSSSLFSGSHFARLLMRRSLSEGAPARPTDFLPLLQAAAGFAKESEVKLLYAVFPDQELDARGWAELPERGRISLPESLRRAYLETNERASVRQSVAESVYEALKDIKLGGSGRKG